MREVRLNERQRRLFQDYEWAETAPEVQQHDRKLVVIHDKKVIAVGTDEPALLKEACARVPCPEEDLVVYHVYRPGLDELPH